MVAVESAHLTKNVKVTIYKMIVAISSTLLRASRTHMLVCECWGEGLIVWEVAQCYRRCLVLRRAKEEVTGWEISEPPLIDVCWTSDGQLYAIDKDANLYSVLSDGIGMVTHLEWSENLTGSDKPIFCSFGNGILIYGPDQRLRLLKKAESKWKVSWTYVMPEEVVRLVSNTSSDMAAVWTHSGRLYYITETDDKIELVLHVYRQRNIIKIQLIAPDNKYLATMNKTGEICIYEVLTGNLILSVSAPSEMASSSTVPIKGSNKKQRSKDNSNANYLCQQLLKKAESKWKVSWTYVMPEEVVRLVSNTSSDMAAVWTHSGRLYYITETDDKIELVLHVYRQRNIIKIQLMAPDNKYLATMNKTGEICIYEVLTGNLILRKSVEGNDISFQASPVEPLLILFGELGVNYGMGLFTFTPEAGLEQVGSMCLTHQIVSQIVFSPTGRQVTAVASSAGHIFVFQLSEQYKLTLVRYTELGRGLADSFLMKVGDSMRSFNLVLFSDKYAIGERIMCINADNGKDNKFAGKMQGPYAQLLPLAQPGCALAVPHLTNQLHVLRLSGEVSCTLLLSLHSGRAVPTLYLCA
ncbi:hypothetical protein RR46_02460 [Papilio xuthus]|uniref:WD repeat-containing protein 19 n=1 Tax=Papilio xuthus TaxID=66420 RepID=A0A194QGU5_PAPXU|nr:hypothetical protein RR46_02460 [Papilio xuthus]